MPRDQETLRIDLRSDGLGHAEHDAANQRPPQRSRTANYRRLKGEDELGGPRIGREGRTHAEEHPGDRDRQHGDAGRHRVDLSGIDSDQPDRVGVFSGGADRAPQMGLGKKQTETAEQRHRRDKNEHR